MFALVCLTFSRLPQSNGGLQVDAIYSTPITLPVKVRVAKGLSRAGTSNTLKCCTYNSILGVIAGLSGGAIRQFCAFAVVVLVAHWFLAHTFFVTVLSIDLQRLEVLFSTCNSRANIGSPLLA